MRLRPTASLWLLALAACGSPGEGAGEVGSTDGANPTTTPEPPRIVLVTHGQSADPFWSVVATGAREAGVELTGAGARPHVDDGAADRRNLGDEADAHRAVARSRALGEQLVAVAVEDPDRGRRRSHR